MQEPAIHARTPRPRRVGALTSSAFEVPRFATSGGAEPKPALCISPAGGRSGSDAEQDVARAGAMTRRLAMCIGD